MAATAKAGAKPRSVRDALPPPPGVPAGPPPAPAPEPSGPLRFSSADDGEEKREPLFYVDDVEYTIPVEPSASIALESLHIIARGGGSLAAQMMAQDYVMTRMLGEDGWAALRGCKTVKKHELKHLIQVVTQKAMAELEDEESPNL